MNKHTIKLIVIIIITIIFIYAYSDSYASRNIDNISYVVGLGIDQADDEESLKITFEFTDISQFSQDSSGESSDPILETVTAPSIDTAINILNVYLAKEVNLAHCKVIVFSKEVAEKGILDKVSTLMNNPQVRPTANIILTETSSYSYLKNSTSSLDQLLTKYYDIFPNSNEYTGYTSNVTIGEFYNSMLESASGNTAILGGENSSTSSKNSDSAEESNSTSTNNITAGSAPIDGDRGTENIGLAVFKDDKYITNLTAEETLYHCILTNDVSSFLITIDNPKNSNEKLDISLTPDKSPEISVDISNDIPTININISLSGKALSIFEDLDYSDANFLNDISNSANEYLNTNILDYLNKTAQDFGCDIDNFYKYGKKNFMTIDEWNNFDWASKYSLSNFNVNVNTSIVSDLAG